MTISLSARRYAVPAIAVLIFSASLLVGLGKLLQESREGSAGIRAMVYWSASQLELEYWRFLDSLGRYAVGAAERDDVLTRLDILWSRLSLYDGGEAGARLSAIDGAPEAIAALGATLRAVEPDIQALKQGDILGYAAIRERLEIHRLPLHDVAQRTNLHEQGRAIAFREKPRRPIGCSCSSWPALAWAAAVWSCSSSARSAGREASLPLRPTPSGGRTPASSA